MDRNTVFPRSVRYLLAVAEHGNFTRAAEELFVSQPTLSQQIKHLEEMLDVQLLDRSGRMVRLTDAGEVYLRYARRALNELDAAKRAIHQLQDLSRGSLQLGITPITEYLATPILHTFHDHYPNITLNILEVAQDDIELGVLEDHIDMGIAFTNTLSNETRSNNIDTHVLFVENLNLAVGKEHPYAELTGPINAHELEQLPLALLNTNFALRRQFDLYCLEHSIEPNIAMETNSLSVIMETVSLGRFVTILPHAIACSQHRLHPVMLLPELPHHEITLICRKSAYKSPACTAFAQIASDWCAEQCNRTNSHRMRPCPLSEICEPEKERA